MDFIIVTKKNADDLAKLLGITNPVVAMLFLHQFIGTPQACLEMNTVRKRLDAFNKGEL